MSTQYGTLSHRRSVRVPMWLIVALVVGALAIGVGYSVDQYLGQGTVATSVDTPRFPGGLETAGVIPVADEAPVFPGGLETAGVIPVTDEAPVFPGGLETSGVAPPTGVGGVATGSSVAAGGMTQPIMINGKPCHQCR